ncbi:MAG: ABC transporter ATP-binding protein [Thermomicrobiales bacterium]|nr:ABC transporter ATP-binding protein [Thermomicrobiales bacterium]
MTETQTQSMFAPRTSGDVLLEVKDLDVHFRLKNGGLARVVDGASLTVKRNEIIGIAGESGSGKTTLVEAILGINRFSNRELGGQVLYHARNGQVMDLAAMSQNDIRRVRLSEIGYVPQGSMNSLSPTMRVADQIIDGMVTHGVSARDARRKVPELLSRVGLDERAMRLYPHELSGGMKQRVIIAIGISMEPSIIIADEPTTALDVNVQRRILATLMRLRDEMGVTIIMVSHDGAVHAELVDRLAIMYAGQVVETGGVRPMLKAPLHPYTKGLTDAIPTITAKRERIEGIRGATPSPDNWPQGCRFHNRCQFAMPQCLEIPPQLVQLQTEHVTSLNGTETIAQDRLVSCHLYDPAVRGAGND